MVRQIGDVDCHAVHRDATQDRKALTAEVDGSTTAQTAWEPVSIAGAKSGKARAAAGYVRSTVTNHSAARDRAGLRNGNGEANDGLHWIYGVCLRCAAIERDPWTDKSPVIVFAHQHASGVGKAEWQGRKFLYHHLHLCELHSV